jgi:hypothetical protein
MNQQVQYDLWQAERGRDQLNADFHGAKSLNISLRDYPSFARKFGKFATETLIGLFCQAWF